MLVSCHFTVFLIFRAVVSCSHITIVFFLLFCVSKWTDDDDDDDDDVGRIVQRLSRGRPRNRSSHLLSATTATTTRMTHRWEKIIQVRTVTASLRRPRRWQLEASRRTVDVGFHAVRWTVETRASYDWRNVTPVSASSVETTMDVSRPTFICRLVV